MSRDNPWRLARPTVSVDIVRRIGDVRHEITSLVLDQLGHAELLGCLHAAGAAVAECARIAMRDVDRARPAVPNKKRLAPARRARARRK